MKKYLIILLLAGCANKPCREPQVDKAALPQAPGTGVSGTTTTTTLTGSTSTRVLIAKKDGSRQCESKGLSPEEMEKQLKGIKVHSRRKESDGMMHIQMCGAQTGRYNVYEIDAADLKKALSMGFQEWKK